MMARLVPTAPAAHGSRHIGGGAPRLLHIGRCQHRYLVRCRRLRGRFAGYGENRNLARPSIAIHAASELS